MKRVSIEQVIEFADFEKKLTVFDTDTAAYMLGGFLSAAGYKAAEASEIAAVIKRDFNVSPDVTLRPLFRRLRKDQIRNAK